MCLKSWRKNRVSTGTQSLRLASWLGGESWGPVASVWGPSAGCHVLKQDLGGKLLNGCDSSWLQLWAGAQRRWQGPSGAVCPVPTWILHQLLWLGVCGCEMAKMCSWKLLYLGKLGLRMSTVECFLSSLRDEQLSYAVGMCGRIQWQDQ